MKERRPPPDPRRSALRILDRVERTGAFASVLLEHESPRFDDSREAALLHEMVLGILRRRAALDHAIGRVASRPVDQMDLELLILLRMGAYCLLYLDRVPPFAVVDTSVQIARETRRASGAGFVNAVLRRIAEQGRSLLPPEPAPGDVDGLARWSSHPAWWLERMVARLGWDETVRLAESSNLPVATVLRARRSRTSPELLRQRLEGDGIEVEPCRFVAESFRVRSGVVQKCEAFREGLFWIQDEASQLAGMLAAGNGTTRVADLCAAPGGKSLLIADALPPEGVVLALDRHEGRLGRLVSNLRKLGEDRVLPVVADSAGGNPLRGGFDSVLVDAPCSGTGTLRRHPEIRYRLRPEDLRNLATRQGRLLDSAAGILTGGGTLVYSVCSLEPEEGEEVVRGFLDRRSDFEILDPRPFLPPPAHGLIGRDGTIRTWPHHDGLDGFFAVVLCRKKHRSSALATATRPEPSQRGGR